MSESYADIYTAKIHESSQKIDQIQKLKKKYSLNEKRKNHTIRNAKKETRDATTNYIIT